MKTNLKYSASTDLILTNYSDDKIVRTCTVCLTPFISQKIVYGSFYLLLKISQFGGSEVHIYSLDAALKSTREFSGSHVMTSKASDRPTDI